MAEPQVDREQLAAVLQQLADHSSDDDLRGHVRQVAEALRGSGLIILNGPPQQAMTEEARIRDAMAEAQDHPGRIVMR